MLKKNLLTGLIVLVPMVLTIWVLSSLIGLLDSLVLLLPYQYQPDQILGMHIPGIGVLLTFIVIFSFGLIANNFFGKKFIDLYEYILDQLPFVKSIYGSIKQVSDTLFSNSSNAFSKAVLIEFPDSQTYTFAFITGKPDEKISKKLKGKFVNVYVPTTPNPTSGYTLMVPESKIKEVDVSVDQALKYVISMGVVAPQDNLKKNNKK